MLNEFILSHKALSGDMKFVSRLLLANQQGGQVLAQMTASPQQSPMLRILSPIVVHTVSVLLCQQKMNILLPFVNILNNPTALVVSFKYMHALLMIYTAIGMLTCST